MTRIDVFNGFSLVDIITDFVSLEFSRVFRGNGQFKLVINDHKLMSIFALDQTLIIDDDAYIVENIHKYKDAEKNIIFEITGKHVNSILSRRVITSFSFSNVATYQDQIQSMLNEHIINTSDQNRKINGFVFVSTSITKKPVNNYTLTNMSLQEAINRACGNAGLGYKIIFLPEEQKYAFKLLESIDATDEVFFSEEYGNISEAEFYQQSESYKNVCVSVVDGITKVYGSGVGIERREMLIEEEYSNELDENKKLLGVEFVANDTEQYEYKKDWDIGYKVSYLDREMNLIADKQILEVKEYHSSTRELEIKFGDMIPTIFDKLKKGVI